MSIKSKGSFYGELSGFIKERHYRLYGLSDFMDSFFQVRMYILHRFYMVRDFCPGCSAGW